MTITSFPLTDRYRYKTSTRTNSHLATISVRRGFYPKKKHRYYSIFDYPKHDVEAKTEELKKNGLLNWCS
jgi:hypothetical protein